MPAKDVREMTVGELCEVADQVRRSPANSKVMRRAADTVCLASMYLECAGALQQMMWWAGDLRPEPPPDARAKLLQITLPSKPLPIIQRKGTENEGQ